MTPSQQHMSGRDVTGMASGALRHGRRISTSRPQWRRATRWMLGMQLYLAAWFWLIAVIVIAAALFVLDRTVGVQLSYFQFVQHGALWFPFALMITVVAAMITPHVANGMTRRSFAVAVLVTAAVVAVLYGLLMAVGLEIEGAVYDSFGWPHAHVANAVDDATPMAEPWTQGFAVSALTYAVRTAAGAVAGMLVAITYYRYGGLRATLALPLTVAPALVSQDALANLLGDALSLSLPALSLLTLVAPLLAAAAFYRITRTVPIAQPWS
ncbi:hypothetical protein GCM10023169_18820 [Georgenia halophila]|uniref:Uncharacterized protein n=1 Tax=Georgenia halophila TaxID=620889 RepID=A0ABP8L5P9_9MICO